MRPFGSEYRNFSNENVDIKKENERKKVFQALNGNSLEGNFHLYNENALARKELVARGRAHCNCS